MKKAVDSAAKWLTDKVRANPKLNPIPYAFFKSIINKQVEWAGKRGVTLNFSELADAVRAELLKAGIYTMSDSKKEAKTSHKEVSLFDGAEAQTRGAIHPLLIKFHDTGEAASAMVIFDWLHRVFAKAADENFSALCITANGIKEADHA